MDDNIIELAKGLVECYEQMYQLCYPEVERIIRYQIKDIDLIEHTLDQALDIYTEKGFYLFINLLLYYRTVNIEHAKDYLEILKEDRKEEYDEFKQEVIKIYKKTL